MSQTNRLKTMSAQRASFRLATALGLALLGLASACAQDPLKLLPNNYRLIFENKDVAVIRAHYGAHEKIPVHDHTSFSTVFVYLSDSGPVRIDHQEEGEAPSSVTRPPTVKGSYRVANGIKERHSIENLGDSSSDFLRVELKKVSLHLDQPFRGRSPQSLSAPEDTIEFSDPAVQIERIICAANSACAVGASSSPSLLITFNAVTVAESDSAAKQQLDAGAVRWLAAAQSTLLTPVAGSSVHILRILLPNP